MKCVSLLLMVMLTLACFFLFWVITPGAMCLKLFTARLRDLSWRVDYVHLGRTFTNFFLCSNRLCREYGFFYFSITFLFSCNQVVVLHAIDHDRMEFLDSQTCSWSVLSKCCNSKLQAGHAFQVILTHSGVSQLGIAFKH